MSNEPTNKQSPNVKKKSPFLKGFEKFSAKVSDAVGSPYWFLLSILLILMWFPTGFFIGFNEIWHLYINSTTTILTFLMMSLLHTSQKKWEKKMEDLQKREGHDLKNLRETTTQLVDTIPPITKDLKNNTQ